MMYVLIYLAPTLLVLLWVGVIELRDWLCGEQRAAVAEAERIVKAA